MDARDNSRAKTIERIFKDFLQKAFIAVLICPLVDATHRACLGLVDYELHGDPATGCLSGKYTLKKP